MCKRRHNYLAVMGIDEWQSRMNIAVFRHSSPMTSTIADMDWAMLAQAVKDCTACPLHQGRIHEVFGVGDRAAQWLIVGEAPNAEEEQHGEPGVGPAGQLLIQMLHSIGLRREQAYITNIIKSRPTANHALLPTAITQCRPYLDRQIALLQPRVILVTGTVVAQNLLATTATIDALRGRVYRYGTARIPLIATYHPVVLLRDVSKKRKAWDDLRLAWRVVHNVPPDGQDL